MLTLNGYRVPTATVPAEELRKTLTVKPYVPKVFMPNQNAVPRYKVYKEVCSSCHSMNYISFRNLHDKGGPEFSEEQVKSVAATYTMKDGPNEAGDMFDRPGLPSDRFPAPFPNEQAARAAQDRREPVPYFTLPENATLAGATAMTALIGRVPIDGRVNDPMQFKAVIGRDRRTSAVAARAAA